MERQSKEYCAYQIFWKRIKISLFLHLGNVLIIVALQKPSSLQKPSKLLLGCLAVTDLCVGLITQPLWVAYLLTSQHSKRCQVIQVLLATIGAVFGGVSLITLTTISVDRLLALKLGLRYRQVVTLRRVWIFIVTTWLSSAAGTMLYIYNFSMVAKSYGTTVVILCIVITTFCYSKIYVKLRHHQAGVEDQHVLQGEPNGGGIALNIARYRKTVSSALWVQTTLMACCLPAVVITAVVVIRGSYPPPLALGWTVTLSFFFVNSFLNPFLYCWKMREVRQAVKDTIKQLWCF